MDKKNIVVLGAGKMGLGIAQLFATKGHRVKVIYVYDDKLRYNAVEIVKKNLEELAENKVLEEKEIPQILELISFVDTMEEVVEFADIIFECIIENVKIKQDYFEKMDGYFPESVILATNSSAIGITEISEKCIHKERVIGTHFWNPAYLIPLVEVIKTENVNDEVVKCTFNLLESVGKKPVIVEKDVPGFLANRMQHALFREALSIIENGIATPEAVDDAIKYGFGLRLGICAPIEVMDMGGLDLTYSIHEYLFPYIENSTKPSNILIENIKNNNLGFKTGKGIKKWSKEDIDNSQKNLITGLINVIRVLERL